MGNSSCCTNRDESKFSHAPAPQMMDHMSTKSGNSVPKNLKKRVHTSRKNHKESSTKDQSPNNKNMQFFAAKNLSLRKTNVNYYKKKQKTGFQVKVSGTNLQLKKSKSARMRGKYQNKELPMESMNTTLTKQFKTSKEHKDVILDGISKPSAFKNRTFKAEKRDAIGVNNIKEMHELIKNS